MRAPSTLGTFLRSFTHGHVQQLDAAGAGLLAGLTRRVPGLLAGSGKRGIAFIDVDDTIREVHGYAKQGAAYGYSGIRGLNVQLAIVSTPISAPVIARARLPQGNTASAKGCGRLLAQAITTARNTAAAGQLMARADSAYYGWAFVGTAIRHHAWFSVTARMTKSVTAAITSISHDVWTPIRYPKAQFDEQLQQWVSDAEVAEVLFVAFTGRRKNEHVTCRLVVRRVNGCNHWTPSTPSGTAGCGAENRQSSTRSSSSRMTALTAILKRRSVMPALFHHRWQWARTAPPHPCCQLANSRACQFVVHEARCAAGPVVAITLPNVAEAPMLDCRTAEPSRTS